MQQRRKKSGMVFCLQLTARKIHFADNARRLSVYLRGCRVRELNDDGTNEHGERRNDTGRVLPSTGAFHPTTDGDALTSPPTKTRTRIVGARESLMPPRVPRSVSSCCCNAKCHRCCRRRTAIAVGRGTRRISEYLRLYPRLYLLQRSVCDKDNNNNINQ